MICLLTLFPITAGAAPLDETLDTAALSDALPAEAAPFLGDVSPLDGSAGNVFGRIWEAAAEKASGCMATALRTAVVLLIVCVLVALSETIVPGEKGPGTAALAGVAAIGASALSDFDSYLNLGLDSLQTMSDYSKALLPTLASAAAISGGAGGAAAKYAATALFMDILLEAARRFAAPGICAMAALSIAEAAVGNHTLKAAKKLLKTVCGLMLTGLAMAFTGYLAVSGVVAETADAMTARMAKTAVSSALPVVGSILSDAAGTLAAAAGVLRGSVGLFGMAAVLCVCIGPFAVLGTRYLAFRLAAGMCGCVADKRFTTLMEDLGTCFGMILALNGVGALMMFLSIYALIRTAV